MSEETDPRTEAAERLMYVALLEAHRQRRGMADTPWRDPRQGQGRVLALLKMQPQITQRELTFLMGMSRQASAELLAKLERQGLVERQPSPEDRRVVVVRLTAAGRAAEQEADRAASDAEALLDALDDEEVARLSDYLRRIIERVERDVVGEIEERREALEELWRSRGGFGPGAGGFPGGFGGGVQGGFPGGWPGGFGGWPGFGGRPPRPGERGPRRGGRGPRGEHGDHGWDAADDERTED